MRAFCGLIWVCGGAWFDLVFELCQGVVWLCWLVLYFRFIVLQLFWAGLLFSIWALLVCSLIFVGGAFICVVCWVYFGLVGLFYCK